MKKVIKIYCTVAKQDKWGHRTFPLDDLYLVERASYWAIRHVPTDREFTLTQEEYERIEGILESEQKSKKKSGRILVRLGPHASDWECQFVAHLKDLVLSKATSRINGESWPQYEIKHKGALYIANEEEYKKLVALQKEYMDHPEDFIDPLEDAVEELTSAFARMEI